VVRRRVWTDLAKLTCYKLIPTEALLDSLTFISKLTEFLAWPIVALVLGLAFKKRLEELLPMVKRMKFGPVEAEFELAAKKVLADASKAAVKEDRWVNQHEFSNTNNRFVSQLLFARKDPAGMILEGWGNVDGELHKFGRQLGIVDDPLESNAKVYSSVMASGRLPQETVELVRELRDLRNKVAHVRVTPTADSAQSYLVAVDRVIELIRNFRKNLPNYGPDNL
jgi:hypothetical protein